MQRGGTVLSEYGVSMQDAVGLITAANESIQDPAKVGTAMKAMAVNMASVKANASKGTMELNKTAKALKEIAGIDVYSDKSKGQVKDMVQILDELNVKLKEGKIEQDEYLALSEALAGKEQAAVFQALMGNYETFKQIQNEFNQGLHFGSAEKENAAYVDSLNGKLNKLKEVWIDTLMVLADSDSLKGLLDVFISISEGINTFIKTLDSVNATLPTLFGIIGGGSSFFKTLSSGLDLAESSGTKLTGGLTGIKNVISKGVVPAIGSFVKQGLLIGGVTAAVQIGAYAWDELTNGVKKSAEELGTVEDEILSNISAQNEKIKILQTTGVEYEKLANKAKRTTEEEEEMIRLGNELAQILPEMTIGYDEEGNAILSMTDDMQGLINKTKEAVEQQNKLLLGNRIEQSDEALKMLTDGELLGKDSKGLNDQKIQVQENYNKRMQELQFEYQAILKQASEQEGSTQRKLLENLSKIRNEMLTEESNFQTQYSDIQSRIVEYSNIFREEMDSTWRNSAGLLTKELAPEMEKSISSLLNALDFSEISDENELEAVRRIFRELPELAQSGAVDVAKLGSQISDINKEFANTGNLEDYHTNMKALAKSISDETGWDASVLEELFTKITDGTLESASSLDTFLETFGKTKEQLQNGDSLAKALQEQFNEMERFLNTLSDHDFSNVEANLKLRMNLQENTDIPKQIRDMVDKLSKAGVEDRYIISVAGELMMSLKDGKLDEVEVEELRRRLQYELGGKMSEQEIEMTVNGILASFNTEEMLKSIEGELGSEKVTKEVTIEADDPKKIEAINEAIEKAKALLTERGLIAKVQAVVEGEEDLVFFEEIIKRLPTDEEHTNKFIVENAQALSQLESYQEVLDYINSLPDHVIKSYGLTTEGLEKTLDDTKELEKTITGVNSNELKVTASNDDVLQTIEDVEALIEISAKVEDGKYKIDIDANTQTAIDNINSFKNSINDLNKSLSSSKTVSYNANTAQAAKNISGLITRVNEIKKLTGKTFKYYADTAQSAKNISGLITRVDQINKRNGKTFTWYANTAQAAKNISGLINRIDQINGKRSRSFNYTVNTTYKEQGLGDEDYAPSLPEVNTYAVSPLSSVADEIASQTSSIQASLRTGVGEINSFSSNMARATIKTPISLTGANINNALKQSVELLQELENRIDKVNNSISLLDKKMENAVGTTKINYLKEQNKLYKEQVNLQKELESSLKKQQSTYKSYLQKKGFKFNSDGNLTNYEEKLIAMEKELARLEAAADKDSDKYNNYSGSSDKKKNSLKSTYEAAKKKADNYANSLAEIKKYLDEYIDITFTELPKVSEEWQDLQNAIAENNREIENLNRENKLYKFTTSIKKAQMQIESISDKLDILSKQMELEGTSTKNLEKYISLLKQQQDLQESLVENHKKSISVYQTDLSKYGFKFDKDGMVSNLDTILNKHQNSSDLEHINGILEEYLALINDELPDAEKELLDVTTAIRDQERALRDLARNNELSKYTNNLKKANMEVEALTDEIDILSKKMNLYGTNTDDLEKYISLLEKQRDLQAGIISDYENSLKVYQKDLAQFGFEFNKDGTINNLDNVLDGYQNTGDLEYINGLLDEYLSLVNNELPDAEKAWFDINIAIKEQEKALKELARNQKLDKFRNQILELNNALSDTANELDIISSKLEYAYGKDKLKLLDKQIDKYREQQEIQQALIDQYKEQMRVYEQELSSLGFAFGQDGSITNLSQILSNFEGEDLEDVKNLIEEYLDIQNGSLPDAEKAWLDLENAIKDTLKSQLDTTKEIEDKITDIYKKQVEERIEALNKETDAKLKALKKQQDAYNKYRDEVDYQNEYEEKIAEIAELQKKLDIAMKDSSLNGQKKVQELQKELAAAQKELENLTQEKIDQNINDMFDKESERIEEENKAAIEELENQWSDTKIAEMVAQALGSGVFTDIEGNVHSLEDVLIDFAEESGELFGVLGSIIESELITNLEIARDTVKDLAEIMNEFDLTGYAVEQTSRSIAATTSNLSNLGSYSTSVSNQVNITSPIINIEGNVDSNIVEELKDISNKIKSEVIDAIATSIR